MTRVMIRARVSMDPSPGDPFGKVQNATLPSPPTLFFLVSTLRRTFGRARASS